MKIEAITVCMDHADILAHTVLFNQRHFDRWVVVTDHMDSKTQKLCKFWGIELVVTDAAQRHLGKFEKGAVINEGLNELSKDAWIVHLDADIALPPNFKDFENYELNTEMLYGLDRVMFNSYEDWQEFVSSPNSFSYPYPRYENLSNRVCGPRTNGYVPLGYFQMWHADSGIFRHPRCWNGSQEDLVFSTFWPRNKRALIPELVCYHLASESGFALNWHRRNSKPFQIDRGEQNVSNLDSNRSLDRRKTDSCYRKSQIFR